jgi:hypothetical protein
MAQGGHVMTEPNNTTLATLNGEPLTPEAVIAQLRTMRSQIEDVAPLSKDQRSLVKQRVRLHTKPVLDASINVIGVLENVSQAIGQPLDDVRLAGRRAPLGRRSRRGSRVPEKHRGIHAQSPAAPHDHRLAGVRDRDTTGKGSGQGRAPAAHRGSQTAERHLASQEIGAGTETAGPGTGRRHVHIEESVE